MCVNLGRGLPESMSVTPAPARLGRGFAVFSPRAFGDTERRVTEAAGKYGLSAVDGDLSTAARHRAHGCTTVPAGGLVDTRVTQLGTHLIGPGWTLMAEKRCKTTKTGSIGVRVSPLFRT